MEGQGRPQEGGTSGGTQVDDISAVTVQVNQYSYSDISATSPMCPTYRSVFILVLSVLLSSPKEAQVTDKDEDPPGSVEEPGTGGGPEGAVLGQVGAHWAVQELRVRPE